MVWQSASAGLGLVKWTVWCMYSGSTGKAKGVLHTQAGYLLYAATTYKYVFDHHDDDVFWCTADLGWITGHTYVCYGPLANAATSVMVCLITVVLIVIHCWACCEKCITKCILEMGQRSDYTKFGIVDHRRWVSLLCSLDPVAGF